MFQHTLSPQEAHARHVQWLSESKGMDRTMAERVATNREQQYPQELSRWADPLT